MTREYPKKSSASDFINQNAPLQNYSEIIFQASEQMQYNRFALYFSLANIHLNLNHQINFLQWPTAIEEINL